MSSFLGSVWDVVGNQVTGFLGTEQERQDKVTGLLVDKPFEFGKSIGLYGDKIEAPPVINTQDVNASDRENFKASLLDMVSNAEQDSEIFRKNLPSSLFEIGEFGIDLAMNPIKYGKEALNLASGFATMPFENIDNASNEEMAKMVYDSTIDFFKTEGALRKASLENPADVLAIMFGGAAGIRRLQALKPETKSKILSTIQQVGATPVGLSMKNVSDNLVRFDKSSVKLPTSANPFFDAAGTYSKAEKTVMDMKQPSMAANQVVPYLQGRGILAAEIKDLNIDDYVKNLDGQSVTQQGLLDHISLNRTSLLSTSLLSPTNTGVNTLNYTPNMVFVHDPYETWEEHGPTPAVERGVNESYQIGEIETPDGTLSVVENPDAVQEINENLMADMRGSVEVNADTEISHLDRSLRARDTEYREHYPFNYVQDNEYYSFTVRQADASRDDDKMARVFFQMHEDKPEKYPLTHGLEAYINNQSIDALEKPNTENQPAITQMLEENKTSLTALQELNNTGVEQWDQILSKALHETKPPSKAIDRGLSMGGAFATMDEALDFDDALSTVAEEEYLYDPTFEQSIVVKQDEDGNDIKYTVAGNDTNGWFVYDPSMNIIADSVDLPRAQAILNQDAQNRDYVRAVDKNEVTEESLYHNYLSSKDAKFVDTYSEELISLVPNTTKKSKYYQGSVIGGEGYEYDQGHYAKVPNTLTSYRKIIVPANSVKKRDGTNADSDVYKIVEAQSDWIQDGRQYGFTQAEYDEIGDQIRVQGRDLRSYRTAISVFEDTMDEYDVNPDDKTHLDTAWAALQDVPNYVFKAAFITNFKKTSHKGVLNLHGGGSLGGSGLSTAKMNSDEFKQAMDEFDVNSKKVEKSINARWENNEYNPDSANFDIHKYSETRMFSDVEDYLVNQQDILDQKRDGWEDHTVSPRTPLKDKNTYLAMTLQDAIQKAHSKGLKYVSWSSGSQILDRWNRSRDLDKKGNIKYKELYSNIYDRGLPKEAKKFLNKYNAGALQEMEVDGQKQYVIEITDELIEALQKDFDLPKDSTMLPMPKYGKANNIPSGLLKTDITNQEGLLV